MIEKVLAALSDDRWRLGGRDYQQRVLHCFGMDKRQRLKPAQAASIIHDSGTEFLTVYTHGDLEGCTSFDDLPLGYAGLRVRDVRPFVDVDNHTVLVNMNHARSPSEILPRAEAASGIAGSNWIKLEVLTDDLKRPRNRDVIAATVILRSRGYEVLPLIECDTADAEELEGLGVLALRVTMADIGSLGGLPRPDHYRALRDRVRIPIIAEGGLGSPLDAFHALAAGADAVLTNSAIFASGDPLRFIRAVRRCTDAGRISYLADRF